MELELQLFLKKNYACVIIIQKKRNYKLSKARAIVEHPFQVIKCQWNYRKTRYRGIAKNALNPSSAAQTNAMIVN